MTRKITSYIYMLKQNQISFYNRYPKIFKEIKKIIPSPSQILSFGCSTINVKKSRW